MITASIDNTTQLALTKFARKFAPENVRTVLLQAGAKAGVAAESYVSPYPQVSGKPLTPYYTRQRADGSSYQSKFASLAQQRKVFALIAEGRIPYRRTGTLGKSITSKASLDGNAVVIRIGTNIPYAKYVIGSSPLQSHYHQGTWTPLEQNIRQNIAPILRVFSQELLNGIRKSITG